MQRAKMLVLMAAVAGALTTGACAADKALASALGASAAKLAADGRTEKAKEICYKALANDAECPEALYELGKLFEKEGKTSAAADFFFRAAQQFGANEAGNPVYTSKRMDAERRLKLLNPFATRFAAMLAEYTQELNAITRKVPDSLTLEEACDRADVLKLRTVLPPDKAPKFERPEAKAPAKTGDEEPDKSTMVRRFRKTETPTVVPPDVERALKGAGWTTITGTWKKKAENVYEVTDGKLETPKVNGAVQVLVHKGGTGSVKVFVRNYLKENEGYSDHWGTGFGFAVENNTAKLFFPSSYSMSRFDSYIDRVENLPEAMPKHKLTMTIMEGKLEYILNDKTIRRGNYQIPKQGPFLIQIEGTMTIESPQAAGQ